MIAGDINKDEVKALVEKYFGEIPGGEPIEKRGPMPATLASTVKLYHEDNFAKAPQDYNGFSNSRTIFKRFICP